MAKDTADVVLPPAGLAPIPGHMDTLDFLARVHRDSGEHFHDQGNGQARQPRVAQAGIPAKRRPG